MTTPRVTNSAGPVGRATLAPAVPPSRSPSGGERHIVGSVGLALTHAKWLLVETFRIPIAWIGGTLFPVLAFCFFALPIPQVRENADAAMPAIVSMMVFAFMANCLSSFGLDIASQRAKPWVPYLRTLPGSDGARIAGLIVSTLVMAIIAALPVLAVGLIFTAAEPQPFEVVLGMLTVIVTAIPSAFIGLIIGTTCGEKAAIGVTQLVMFTMAFGSGLFLPPMMFPDWLDLATRFLPVRAARELSIAVATGGAIEWWAVISLVIWTIVLGVIGLTLFRRDEGRRYR